MKYFSDRIASIEDVRCELQALGVEPSYMRATQIEGDARTVISAVHVVIDSEETAHMWDNYGKSNTTLILQYLGKEVTLSVPVNHQTACLETPFEHWQRYSNEYEAPITRLSVLLPADRFDRSALNRFAKTVKTDVSGCECIWTQEAAPILHISVDGILQQEYSTIIKAALASYERIAGIGEADGPALAIFRDKDSLRILQFKWNSVSYQATYQGTFYLANFGKALLIAPHREDFQAVYGQNASVTLEILVYNSVKKHGVCQNRFLNCQNCQHSKHSQPVRTAFVKKNVMKQTRFCRSDNACGEFLRFI